MTITRTLTSVPALTAIDTLNSPRDRQNILVRVGNMCVLLCTPLEAQRLIKAELSSGTAKCVFASTDGDQDMLLLALAGYDLTNPERLRLLRTILLPPATASTKAVLASGMRAVFERGGSLHCTLCTLLRGVSVRAIFGLLRFPCKISATSQRADCWRAADATTFFLSLMSYGQLVTFCCDHETTVYTSRVRELLNLLVGFIVNIDPYMYDNLASSVRPSALALYILLQRIRERFWERRLLELHPLVMETFKGELCTATTDIQQRAAAIIPVACTDADVLAALANAVRDSPTFEQDVCDLARSNPDFVRYLLTARQGWGNDMVALCMNILVQSQFAQPSWNVPYSEGHLLLCHLLSVLPKKFIAEELRPQNIRMSDLVRFLNAAETTDRASVLVTIALAGHPPPPRRTSPTDMAAALQMARVDRVVFFQTRQDPDETAGIQFSDMSTTVADELNAACARMDNAPSFLSEHRKYLFVKLADDGHRYAIVDVAAISCPVDRTISIPDAATALMISAGIALTSALEVYLVNAASDGDFPLEDIHSVTALLKRENRHRQHGFDDVVPLALPLLVAMHLCITSSSVLSLVRRFFFTVTTQAHLDHPDSAADRTMVQTFFSSGAPVSAVLTFFQDTFAVDEHALYENHSSGEVQVNIHEQLAQTFAGLSIVPASPPPFDCAGEVAADLHHVADLPNFLSFPWVDSRSRWAACAIKRLGASGLLPHEIACLIVQFALKAIIPEAQAVDSVYQRALSYYDLIPTQ
jgi:hypothetical protein